MVRARYDRARAVGEVEGVTAAETRERLTAALLARLGGRAALAPAVHGAPPRRDSGQAELTAFAAEARVLLSVAGVCRLPQVVFPVAISADGPLALSLIGPPGTDLALIRMASRLSERLAPSGENLEAMG
jgi:amidase